MTPKLGSRLPAFGKRYEVTTIRKDGSLILRPLPYGTAENGTKWTLGDFR